MSTTAEAEIRTLIEQRIPALAHKDATTLTAPDHRDLVVFDVVGQLRQVGAVAHATRVEEWLAAYPDGIDYQIRDLNIHAAGDLAFCHYLYRVDAVNVDGTRVTMWVRATICLREENRSWVVVHEHDSVPFDVQTGLAAVGLNP